MLNDKVIVYFDGVCGLCNSFVDFLVEKDKRDVFRFAPLQSEQAKAALPANLTGEDLSTVVVSYRGRTYFKSKAVLLALSHLGGTMSLFKAGHLLPAFVADKIYDFVARRRYAWFGRREMCRLPTAAEKHKFLS